MKTRPVHQPPVINARGLYLILFCLLVLELLSIPGFAQTSKRVTRVHSTAEPKEGRSDVVRFGERVQAALVSTGNDKAFWGVLITDVDTGEVLYSVNAGHYFMPASNVKLFTTTMALATLGPDFRIRTTVESAAEPDSSGRLQGDLVLVGRGDANLSSRVIPFAEHPERNGRKEEKKTRAEAAKKEG